MLDIECVVPRDVACILGREGLMRRRWHLSIIGTDVSEHSKQQDVFKLLFQCMLDQATFSTPWAGLSAGLLE